MSKSRKPAPGFNIESWDWGNATAEAEMACAHAETMLKELPQEELGRIHAAALEYLDPRSLPPQAVSARRTHYLTISPSWICATARLDFPSR